MDVPFRRLALAACLLGLSVGVAACGDEEQGVDEPAREETLYGVFIQACNNSDDSRQSAEDFKVIDNQGNEFEPQELEPDNAFAYQPKELLPEQCIPEAGSVAQLGPTAGSMLLFKVPLQTTQNPPLELEIEGEGDEHLTFELDL